MIKQHLYAITYGRCFGPEAQAQIKNPVMDETTKFYREITQDMAYQNSLDRLEIIIAEAELEVSIFSVVSRRRMVF
jgi:hypothetical protein